MRVVREALVENPSLRVTRVKISTRLSMDHVVCYNIVVVAAAYRCY